MTDFDPTTIQIPFGLLTPEQQDVLMEWPHGWQTFDVGGWADRSAPAWSLHMTYRGKPAPVGKVLFAAVYQNDVGRGYESLQDALANSTNRRSGFICAYIADGELKDVRVVKEDET